MKFETILDVYSLACGKLDYRTQSHDEFVTNLRQCDAFRARLVRMYEELNYRKNWYRMPLGNEAEQAYYHGVDVGLEVADPELFGEDHVALS